MRLHHPFAPDEFAALTISAGAGNARAEVAAWMRPHHPFAHGIFAALVARDSIVNATLSLATQYAAMAGITLPPLKWLLVGALAAGAWAYHQDVPVRTGTKGGSSHRIAPAQTSRPRLPVRVALPASRPNARNHREDRMATGALSRPVPRPKAEIAVRSAAVPKPKPQPEDRRRPAMSVSAAVNRGAPIRGPQAGDCQCPYDLMIDGSACGERSALSRGRVSRTSCYR
ncbi:hypothetical protein [Mesorhizobium xinjiangense]|uniref:hypothetical protein n=1 Tax=Mesorhizobium xinjiangense TaxID=2678685 RepID=UPI0012ED9403|nr:hypothetical protein [Mesorhizobium xinjiangense]